MVDIYDMLKTAVQKAIDQTVKRARRAEYHLYWGTGSDNWTHSGACWCNQPNFPDRNDGDNIVDGMVLNDRYLWFKNVYDKNGEVKYAVVRRR